MSEEETTILEQAFIDGMKDQGLVMVSKDELTALVAQNADLKADIIALVNVFGMFSGLFTGKGGITQIITLIPKLMKDKGRMEEIAHIIPIIEKYTAKPAETDDKEQ